MSQDESEQIIAPILSMVGRWAVGIIVTIALFGFWAGGWATRQDIRTSSLEARAVEIEKRREDAEKRQRRIEAIVVQMARKQGINTDRIDD